MVDYLMKDANQTYILQAYVVMPDHLHLILKPINGFKLAEIMQGVKGASAYQFNKLMNRTGKFWQKENFDHLTPDCDQISPPPRF